MRITTSIVFLLLSEIASYAACKEIYYFPKESVELYINAAMKCISDSGYDSSIIIDQIKQRKYTEDDKTVKVLICTSVNTGFGYADGKFNVEKFMKDSFPTRQDVRPIMEECNQKYGRTPVETFKSIVTCLVEKLPFSAKLSS